MKAKSCLYLLGTALLLGILSFNNEIKIADAYYVKENTSVAKQIADEGTILLRNEKGVLPLTKEDVVIGVGEAQNSEQNFGGSGSGNVISKQKINYQKSLEDACQNRHLIKSYNKVAANYDDNSVTKVLYFIGRSSTEGEDNTTEYFYLTSKEKSELRTLIDNYGADKIIVILNVGGVIDTSWLIENNIAGIICPFYGGNQSGPSLVDVLTGVVNPSGKTTDTWAKSYEDYPSSNNFANDLYIYYEEDIYVGYRYFSTFDPTYQKVNYEFGYGLSYTNFNINVKNFRVADQKVKVDIEVKNTGDYYGKEVIQLYYQTPSNLIKTPCYQLGAYIKTEMIKPKSTYKGSLEFSLNNMASFDESGIISKSSYVLEQGEYKFYLGNSLKNATESALIGKVSLDRKVVYTSNVDLSTNMLKGKITEENGNEVYEDLITDEENNKIIKIKNGYNIIQAEDFINKSSSATRETFFTSLTKGVGVGNLTTSDGFLEFNVDVEDPGIYQMGFNISSQINANNKMFTVYLDDENTGISPSMNPTHGEGDGKWHTYGYCFDQNYTINFTESGIHKIKLEGNGGNFQNIDCFTIFNNMLSLNNQTEIGAECFKNSSFNENENSTLSYPNGIASNISLKEGTAFTYEIISLKESDYYLKLLASNIIEASDDIASIIINNQEISDKMALKRTAAGSDDNNVVSNYYTFLDTSNVKVHLKEGKNTVKIITKNKSICLIDSLVFTPFSVKIDDYEYYDNTNEFKINTDYDGIVLDKLITYEDVYKNPNLIDDFLSQLSISELISLLGIDSGSPYASATGTGVFGGRRVDSKYKIPDAITADGPMGIRYTNGNIGNSTFFPCLTMLASTWNLDLVREFGKSVGKEAITTPVQMWLAPGLNIHRNPLCGRNFEYLSEDPLVSGLNGSAITLGSQSQGLSVCIKHFFGNNQETARFSSSSIISERAQREIYLKPFEIVVKNANPYAIMSCYNQVNGEYVASNKTIMKNLLRDEWGFKGLVVSDWSAWVPHTSLVLAEHQIKSSNPDYSSLLFSYTNGIITRDNLEINAKYVIEFLINSTVSQQKVHDICIENNKDTSFELNKYSYMDEIDNKYVYYYKIYVEENSKYKLSFDKKIRNICIDGEEYIVNGKSLSIDLEDGLHLIKVVSDKEIIDGKCKVYYANNNSSGCNHNTMIFMSYLLLLGVASILIFKKTF